MKILNDCLWIHGLHSSWKLYCTAGFSRANPTEDASPTGDTLALGQQLERHIRDEKSPFFVLHPQRISVPPLGWGTEAEVKNGIELAIKDGFDPKDKDVTLLISSNQAHHRRIGMYVKAYKPQAWQYLPVVAKHRFTLRSHISEFVKMVRDFRRIRALAKANVQ